MSALWLTLAVLGCRDQPRAPAPAARATDAESGHRLVALLNEVVRDYNEAMEANRPDAHLTALSLAQSAEAVAAPLARAERYRARLAQIQAAIARVDQPYVVQDLTEALAAEVLQDESVQQWPSQRPDLAVGRRLYQSACVACHGADGSGQGAYAGPMEPPPADLRNNDLINNLSPFQVFSGVTFGIPGTGMPSNPGMSEAERWAASFFVFALRHPGCQEPVPALELRELATLTDNQLRAQVGDAQLGCVRQLAFRP